MNTHDQPLVGRWISLTDSVHSPVVMDATWLEFRDDGTLIYRLSSMEAHEHVSFQYAPVDDSLLLHHPDPSDDWEKQVPFELTQDGMLSLSLGSMKLLFMRSLEVH